MPRFPDQAEQAYLTALDLEAEGRTDEALAAYQSIIDHHGRSLWSDAAAQAMDRIAGGDPLSIRLSEARVPFYKRFTRPLSFRHALVTALIVIIQSAVTGPLVAGSWLVLVSMQLDPVPFIYMVGGIPATVSGLLFAAWILRYSHLRGYMPEHVVPAGMICGAIGVVFSYWVLWVMATGNLLPAWAVMFLVIHGVAGGAFTGWLGAKLVWYRMNREAPPFQSGKLDDAHGNY